MATNFESYALAHRARRAKEDAEARERAAQWRLLAQELAQLCHSSGARRVLLFGSVARGFARPDSDVDLGVEGIPAAQFFAVYGRVLTRSTVPVDLIDLQDCTDSLRRHILETGIEL